MSKLILIDDFAFDANVHTKQQIESLVQAKFDNCTEPGTLKICYEKTTNGYNYKIDRYLPYSYIGDFIIDVDCSFLTGLPIKDFQSNPVDPNHKPLVLGFAGRNTDGYYIPTKLFEDFYKEVLGSGNNSEQPKKVKVSACGSFVNVEVEY